MNIKKNGIVLYILAGILCASAFGQAKSNAVGAKVRPRKVNPMLVFVETDPSPKK